MLSLSSCSFRSREALLKTPFDTDTISSVFVSQGNSPTENYYNIIQPEDELAINNLQDIELIAKSAGSNSQNMSNGAQGGYSPFKVDANGDVLLPKIGKLHLAGLNRAQAAEKIQKAYEEKELKAPLIDVRIANAYITVLGDVSKQGKFLITREDYELIDLLGDAGGLLPTANKKMVKIFRGGS